MGLETLATLLTTTAQSYNNDDVSDTLSTTAVCSMSTATAHPATRVDIIMADNYINSLSDTQLVEFSNILEEREKNFTLSEQIDASAKTYIKTNGNKQV